MKTSIYIIQYIHTDRNGKKKHKYKINTMDDIEETVVGNDKIKKKKKKKLIHL